MLTKYTTLILVLTVFQTAFFLIFLSTHKKGKLISNKILAAYFLTILLILGNSLLFRLQLHLRVPHLAFQGTKFIFLSSPILYFYTKSLTQEQFKFKPVDLWHLTPFVLFSALVFFVFDLRTAAEKIRLLTPPSRIIDPVLSLSLDIAYYLQVFVYVMLSLKLLKDYRKNIRQVYAATERINLSWLRFVLYGFIIIWAFDVSMVVIREHYTGWEQIYAYISALSRTYTFIYINIFIFKGLKHPQIFHETDVLPTSSKYEHSLLTKENKNKYLKMLLAYMTAQKPYLNPSITINQIATALQIPPKYLSQVINEKIDQNFFDFINSYRIEAAKKMMTENSTERLTVLEILYEVGFNSKSSFNTAFKRFTGLTPSQYKRLSSIKSKVK